MRILVTGATGLVGNNCLRELARNRDHELHVLVRENADDRPFEGIDVSRHFADLTNQERIAEAMPAVDAIIHSAGDTHIGKIDRPQQHVVNVVATDTIARIALETGARLVFVSSVDALPTGHPDQPTDETTVGEAKHDCGYVTTKREAEQRVRAHMENGLDAVIVNPGFMLGPWDWKPSSGRMLLEVATKFTPFGPKGGFSVCDVRDVAAAICTAVIRETRYDQYILAGSNVRYIDAWRVFASVSGGSAPICPAGPLMRIMAGRWGDTMATITGREGDVNSAAIGMSDLYHYYDSTRAIQDLDYRVRDISESAGDAWDWFLKHGYVPGRRK